MSDSSYQARDKSLSIQNVFLLFFSGVFLILGGIVLFMFADAYVSYRDSYELQRANRLLIDSRKMNYALSDQAVAATLYQSAMTAAIGTESVDAARLEKIKSAWLASQKEATAVLAGLRIEINRTLVDPGRATVLKQLLDAETILSDLARQFDNGEPPHPDTLLEAYATLFNTLDFARSEMLRPQNAGQFAFQQSLLVEKAVQNIYDLTVTEGALLTRIIDTQSPLDDQILNRLALLREEASGSRSYLDLYLDKIVSQQGFYKSQDSGALKEAVETMEASLQNLDDVRRRIYAVSLLGNDYGITVEEWQNTLGSALENIRRVESMVVIPAETAVRQNVATKLRQMSMVSAAGIAAIMIMALLFIFLRRNVLAPVIDVTGRMSALAAGELNVKLPKLKRRDEIASMVKALEIFKNIALESKRLASFPEKNPDPIIELNENGIITYINPAAAEEFPDISVDAMSHPLFSDFVDLQVESLSETATIVHEKQVREKFYERYTTFIRLPDKVLIRVFLRDITKRIEKDRALKETQEKAQILLNTLETSNTGIVMVDIKDGERTIDYVNDSFLKLTGYKKDEFIGQNYKIWFNENMSESLRSDAEMIMRTQAHLTTEIEMPKADGSHFWCRLRMAPVHAERGKSSAYIFIMNDITEERAREEFERKQQNMVSISKMAGGMAHEINNALQPILGLSETMLHKFQSDSQYESDRELAKVIYDYADYARNIVHDMLSFTKQDARKAEDLNAVDILTEAVAFARETLPAGVRLTGRGLGYDSRPEKPLTIKASKTGLFQIFTNLMKNSCHAMDNDGDITVEISSRKIEPGNALAVIPGNYVVISISDTGSGMDEATKAKVFEPFFSTKEIGKGTGLGLSVIYGIIKNWNAEIFVDSIPGEGTTFTIYMPTYG